VYPGEYLLDGAPGAVLHYGNERGFVEEEAEVVDNRFVAELDDYVDFREEGDPVVLEFDELHPIQFLRLLQDCLEDASEGALPDELNDVEVVYGIIRCRFAHRPLCSIMQFLECRFC
jgi:hypothetical protein